MNPTSARMPTTSAQYGIWMAQQMAPESPSYWTAETIELRGPLDLAVLSASAVEVLNHSQTLHMRFQMDHEGLWQTPQPVVDAPLPVRDFSAEADPDAAAQRWMQHTLSVVCDLTRDPLYASAVLRLAPDRHLWYLQVHHIALDGYGYSLVCQAVATRYSARVRDEALAPLPDWTLDKLVQAEQAYKAQGRFERDRAFWLQQMQYAPGLATLAPVQAFSDAVLRHSSRLSAAEIERLQQAAHRCGQDWGSWMLAAIGLWLARHSGQHALTFGMPVMNRLGTPALGVPCMAMNIVPMHVQVDPALDMAAMSRQLAERLRRIRPHLYYRYGWIRGDLGLLEIGKHLFNQAVNLMPFDRHAPFEGLHSSIHPISAGPVKDLNISLSVLNAEWRLLLEANPHAYSTERLAALHADLLQWLHTLAAYPAQTPLAPLLQDLPPPARLQGPALTMPVSPVLELLQAAEVFLPDKVALAHRGEAMGYAQLLHEVRRLAAGLRARGLQPQDRVVILLPRSPQAIVAMLAVLWAGGCYVPLDPLGPPSRLALVLADAAPQQVVTQRAWAALAGGLPLLCLDEPWAADLGAQVMPVAQMVRHEDPAYLLYTSGSTGRPNGVVVGHGALAHFVASAGQLYGITAQDRVLQFAPLHFDASIEEIFLALCHGATLVLRDDEALDSPASFASFVEQARISVLDLPTAYWHELAYALTPLDAARLHAVRLTIIGGEAALPERARRWRALVSHGVLLNSYGPTEATVIATAAVLSGPQAVWDGDGPLPIGQPRPGLQALVVDEQMYPVAEGRAGELLLCGPALALAYRGNADLTERRFVTLQTLPGQPRAYRTGDRVSLQDGQLVFLGRLDDEIKISGLRIDPSEIENILLQQSGWREVAVLPQPRAQGGWMLAACVVGPVALDVPALRRYLAERLPAPAIPDHWHLLDSLPRNVNGKIDRQQLAAQVHTVAAEEAALPPANALERQIMQVWHAVLGRMPESVQTNFFDLGGKSLQAIQVSSQLSRALQREVAVSALFKHATVQALAQALSAPVAHRPPPAAADQAFAPLLTIQQGRLPALFCVHPAEGLSWCYLGLARYLPDLAIYGLQATSSATELPVSFEQMVDAYVARIRGQQAHGPYRLLGWSLGGALAQAMAVRLRAQGETVELLALMDSYPASAFAAWRAPTLHDALITLLSVNGELDADTPQAIYQRLLRPGSPLAALGREALERLGQTALHGMQLFRASQTPYYGGDLLLFHAGQRDAQAPAPASWLPYLGGRLECVALDCNHFGMSDPGPMQAIGLALAGRLQADAVATGQVQHDAVAA